MIDNQGGRRKKTEIEKNLKQPSFIDLSFPVQRSEMKNKNVESFQDQFPQSMVHENNKATPALSGCSQHSTASSQQEQSSMRNKTNQAKIADSHVATTSYIAAMNEEENNHARKKLRLSKEQAMLLEENFRKHATLDPNKTQANRNRLQVPQAPVSVAEPGELSVKERGSRVTSLEHSICKCNAPILQALASYR
ncbi:Homeobox-leucine zipper protein HOX7 [Carex littledalei]|uniref:Homeobox-leucine zipper protein HOX7 n=1 Tax=Carex littledalei TaxID=544730 RepID=A0A833VH30_9POAL|nr:Homeobox-leucine zipper protein HOX7 [Carex littledalei]